MATYLGRYSIKDTASPESYYTVIIFTPMSSSNHRNYVELETVRRKKVQGQNLPKLKLR